MQVRCAWILTLCLAVLSALFLSSCSPSAGVQNITISFFGAAETVGGACFLVELDDYRLLVDCGQFYVIEGEGGVEPDHIPPIPTDIDAVVLTHAHLDHWGRLPELALRDGGIGEVFMTEITAELLEDMNLGVLHNNLAYVDLGPETFLYSIRSCRDLRSDDEPCIAHSAYGTGLCASWNKGVAQLGQGWAKLELPRTELDAAGFRLCYNCVKGEVDRLRTLFVPQPYNCPWQIAPGATLEFLNAGHIPGSAMVMLECRTPDGPFRLLFSGDLGSGNHPFLAGWRVPDSPVHALILESTYGKLIRDPSYRVALDRFQTELGDALANGRRVIIPVFALDRAQRLLFHVGRCKELGLVDLGIPVYLGGRAIQDYTELYGRLASSPSIDYSSFSQTFSDVVPRFAVLEQSTSEKPYAYRQLLSLSSEDRIPAAPCVLIATSADGEHSVSHELICRLAEASDTDFFLVSYADKASSTGQLKQLQQPDANGVLDLECGSFIVDPERIHSFTCFSGHSDARGLLRLAGACSEGAVVFLVHGMRRNAEDLKGLLASEETTPLWVEIPSLEAVPEKYVLYPRQGP